MSGFRPPEGSLERRRSDLYSLVYATWDTSMGQPVGTKTAQFFDRLIQALAPEGSLPGRQEIERAESPQVTAAYAVAAAEGRLKNWVRENAKSWGAADVESFDALLLQVRETANLEGAHMRVSRETSGRETTRGGTQVRAVDREHCEHGVSLDRDCAGCANLPENRG